MGMFKVLQFLGFLVYQKTLRYFFVELIRGGGGGGAKISKELLHFKKKFFGYVENSADSWISGLSKNFTRLFRRTHPGGGGKLLA